MLQRISMKKLSPTPQELPMTPLTVTAQESRTATSSPIIARESWRISPLHAIGMKTPSLNPPLPRDEEVSSCSSPMITEGKSQRTTLSQIMTHGAAATVSSQTGTNKSPKATTALSPVMHTELHTASDTLCEEIIKPLLLQNQTAHNECNLTLNDIQSIEKPERARIELGDSPTSDKTEDIVQRDECNPKRPKNAQGISFMSSNSEENNTQHHESLVELIMNASAHSMAEETRKLDDKGNETKLDAAETKANVLPIAEEKRKSNNAEDVTNADSVAEEKRMSDEHEESAKTLIDFKNIAIIFVDQSETKEDDQVISRCKSTDNPLEAPIQGYSMTLGDYESQEYQKLDKVQKDLVLALVEFKAKSDMEERLAKQDERYNYSCANMEERLHEQKERAVRAPSPSRPDLPGDEAQRLRQRIHYFQNQTRKFHIHYSTQRKSRYSSCYWCCRCRGCKNDVTDDEDNSDSK